MIDKLTLSKDEVNEAILEYLEKRGIKGTIKLIYLFSYQKAPLCEPIIKFSGIQVARRINQS